MRSRDRLIRELYDEACTVTRRIFEPHLESIDCVLTGGERQTINGFLKRCEFLERSDLPVMKRPAGCRASKPQGFRKHPPRSVEESRPRLRQGQIAAIVPYIPRRRAGMTRS